jgi:hypothetical protein
VRFSIRDDDADSERSRIAEKGAMSLPISASKRAISVAASVANDRTEADSGTSGSAAIAGSTDAR